MVTQCLRPLAAPNSRPPKLPSRNRTKYTYDARGLISSVHSHAGWAHYTYDARAAVLTRLLPNGSCTYYAYDAAGRVSSIADKKKEGTPICSFAFSRDPNGNILTSEREDGSCWYYEHDGMQRLTGADWKDDVGATLYAYEYGYDRVGNRTHIVYNGESTYYSYNAANELEAEKTLGGDAVYYTYDGRGNQTERRVLSGDATYFAYDSRDLITRIDSTEAGFTPNTFGYNALGQRVRKTDSTGATYYVWDGLNITHEHDGSGTVTRRYTHGHTPIHGVFSLISVQDRQGCRFCYHMDQVGGIHRLTDAWGNVIKTYEYSPFGRILGESGAAPNRFTFPATYGRLPDLPSTRLSPTRVLDASLGRFLSREIARVDPRSRYTMHNPTGEVDPDALDPVDGSGGDGEDAVGVSGLPLREQLELLTNPDFRLQMGVELAPGGRLIRAPWNTRREVVRTKWGAVRGWICCEHLGPQKMKVEAAVLAACRKLWRALHALPVVAKYHPRLGDLSDRQDRLELSDPTTRKRLKRILERALARACAPGIEIQCDPATHRKCSANVAAWTRYGAFVPTWGAPATWYNIHLCPSFFALTTPWEDTILDELSHYGGAKMTGALSDQMVVHYVDFLTRLGAGAGAAPEPPLYVYK